MYKLLCQTCGCSGDGIHDFLRNVHMDSTRICEDAQARTAQLEQALLAERAQRVAAEAEAADLRARLTALQTAASSAGPA